MSDRQPRPAPDADAAPFWEACRAHQLQLQRCSDCATWRFPPRPRCPACRSNWFAWTTASGRGRIASYTLCHPPVLPGFADRVPYNVIVVELDEGPFLVSNLVADDGSEPREPEVGAAVTVAFATIDEELTLPRFRAI